MTEKIHPTRTPIMILFCQCMYRYGILQGVGAGGGA